ncbi:hypothetical protein Tco_1158327 [Tanacetum coccineum]
MVKLQMRTLEYRELIIKMVICNDKWPLHKHVDRVSQSFISRVAVLCQNPRVSDQYIKELIPDHGTGKLEFFVSIHENQGQDASGLNQQLELRLIDETASTNRFVCLNFEKSSSKDFTLSSNLNKEPKVGRFYEGGISIFVVIGTSTREVDSVFRLRMESIPVSGLGLSMLEMKPDDTE